MLSASSSASVAVDRCAYARRFRIEHAHRTQLAVHLRRVLAAIRNAQHRLPQAAAPVLLHPAAAEHLAERLLQSERVLLVPLFLERRLQPPRGSVCFAELVSERLLLDGGALCLSSVSRFARLAALLALRERVLLRVVASILRAVIVGLPLRAIADGDEGCARV